MLRAYRNNLLLAIALILLVGGLLFTVGIIVRRLHADTLATLQAQNAAAQYEHNESAWKSAKDTFASDAASVASLKNEVITPDTVPTFLSTLENLATTSGVQFSISNVSTDSINKTPALSITFKATGSHDALTRFLDAIESQPQATSFLSFLFAQTADDAKGSAPFWQVDAKIRVISFMNQ